MNKVFKVIVKDGFLTKGKTHTQKSFKQLNLSDLVFVNDELHNIVKFDESGNPMLANVGTRFDLITINKN